jgi:hypothetical protein
MTNLFRNWKWFRDRGHITSITQASKLLGIRKQTKLSRVYPSNTVLSAWGDTPSLVSTTLYHEKDYIWAHKESEKKEDIDWRLMWVAGGRTIADMTKMRRHFQGKDLPLFYPGANTWYGNHTCESGYYLVNIQPMFCDKDYLEQLDYIRTYAKTKKRDIRPAPLCLVVEAALSILLSSGEYILERTLHDAEFVRAGYFDEKGMVLLTRENTPLLPREDCGIVTYIHPGSVPHET